MLGRRIEWITADTETSPETGSRVAERFVTQEDCAFLIGAVHSGVAHAITKVADKHGVIYLNTNSSAPSEARENCSRIKFVWDGNGTNFAKAAVKNAIQSFGTRCPAADQRLRMGPRRPPPRRARSCWRTAAASSASCWCRRIRATSRPFLRKIRDLKPDVVATAVGGVDFQALRAQVIKAKMDAEAGLDHRASRTGRTSGARPTACSACSAPPGITSSSSRACRSSSRKWQAVHGTGRSRFPATSPTTATWRRGNCSTPSTRAGSTNNIKIIHQLESLKIPARDRMQHFDAYMNPNTHQMQQTIYLARRNPKPSDATDYFEIVSWADPKSVEDPAAPDLCRLVPYEQVPVVDS